MFLGIVAVSATDLIVDKGKPTELAVYQRQGWRSENNLLCGGGEGNNLRALYSYQPDGLTVDLDFSIAELNATAAGIGLGDMLFGFDGGKAANLFTEDAKGLPPLSVLLATISNQGNAFWRRSVASREKRNFSSMANRSVR